MKEPTMLDSTSDIVSKDICGKIKRWLLDEEWGVLEGQSKDARWILICEDQFKRKMQIVQRNDRPDQVLILGGVSLDDTMKTRMQKLESKERMEFRWQINLELLRTSLEFKIEGTPMQGVKLSQRIYYDALTKDELIQRVSCLRRVIILIIALLQQKFKDIPEERKLGFQIN